MGPYDHETQTTRSVHAHGGPAAGARPGGVDPPSRRAAARTARSDTASGRESLRDRASINLWNTHVTASPLWGDPRPKPLADLRKAMSGTQAPPGLADTFELLSARWRKDFAFDPRLVGEWSFDATEGGRHQLVCETTLPDGVEAHVPPPAEKRIAVGGKFLDEVSIRQSATSYLSFPVESHRGEIGADGVATIHTKMPTVAQLFAEGRLTPVGGAPVVSAVAGAADL